MSESSRVESPTQRRLIPLVLFLGSLPLVAGTHKDYGVTWDEPPCFHASDLHIPRFSQLARNITRGEIEKSIADAAMQGSAALGPLPFPHPPFSRIILGLTKAGAVAWPDKVAPYRLGPALCFALLVTVVYVWMSKLFDRPTGLFSALAAK